MGPVLVGADPVFEDRLYGAIPLYSEAQAPITIRIEDIEGPNDPPYRDDLRGVRGIIVAVAVSVGAALLILSKVLSN